MSDLVVREENGLPNTAGSASLPMSQVLADNLPPPPQKAAIILSVLETDAAVEILSSFNESTLSSFARAVMEIEAVPTPVLEQVIDEFLLTLGDGPSVRGGLSQAKKMLGGVLDDGKLNRMIDKIENPEKGVVWDRLASVAASETTAYLQLEHPQTISFILSRIRPDKAAGVLEGMPRDLSQEVLLRLSRVATPEDSVVEQLEQVMATEFLSVINEKSSAIKPAELIGGLMNNVSSSVRDELIGHLQSNDADLAQDVLKVMFTFADIATRVQPNDVAKIVKDVAEDRLIIALRYAKDEDNPSYEFMMSNLSKRLAERLTEDIDGLDGVKVKDAEAAQMETVNLIQAKAKSGDIELLEIEQEDD